MTVEEIKEMRPLAAQCGRLIYVVGPSGAGKDTILRHLEAALPLDANVAIARRTITRAAEPQGERHIPVTRAAFAELKNNGAFVLDWESHGLCYGIGRESLSCLEAGMCVLVNGSRAHVREARARFGDRTSVVLVTASSAVLAERLACRRRETSDEIEERLARTAQLVDDVKPDLVISNDGDLALSVAALRDHILQSPAPMRLNPCA